MQNMLLNLIPHIPQTLPQHLKRLINIPPPLIRHTNTHMSKPYILRRDLLMQPPRKNHAPFQNIR